MKGPVLDFSEGAEGFPPVKRQGRALAPKLVWWQGLGEGCISKAFFSCALERRAAEPGRPSIGAPLRPKTKARHASNTDRLAIFGVEFIIYIGRHFLRIVGRLSRV